MAALLDAGLSRLGTAALDVSSRRPGDIFLSSFPLVSKPARCCPVVIRCVDASANHGTARVFPFLGSRRKSWNGKGKVQATQADDLPPSDMTLESALKLLGVHEEASFDEILRAKKSLIDSSNGNQETLMKVEAAYDILLMQSLSRRRAGKVTDKSVRFADVKKARPAAAGGGGTGGPAWLQSAVKSTSLSIDTPASNTLAVQTAVFAALAAWTFAGGLGRPEFAAAAGADTPPGLQLAAGFGASLYFLRQQNVKLGKATLITLGGLAIGAVVGNLAEAWLQVEIFPVLGISSPAVLVSEFTFLSLWLTSAYVR